MKRKECSDEVGFIVQAVKDNDMLRFFSNWMRCKNMIANKVWIKNRDGEWIPDVVCSKPVDFMNAAEWGKSLDVTDAMIDVGASSAKEGMDSFHIGMGVPVVPAIECSYDERHEIFLGNAFDHRIGCATVIETMVRLQGSGIYPIRCWLHYLRRKR